VRFQHCHRKRNVIDIPHEIEVGCNRFGFGVGRDFARNVAEPRIERINKRRQLGLEIAPSLLDHERNQNQFKIALRRMAQDLIRPAWPTDPREENGRIDKHSRLCACGF
jgi:hypothetical protein